MATPSPKKSSLSLLIGVSPKSRNQEGMTTDSETAPDQGGMEEEMVEEEVVEKPERSEPSIQLPPGFKTPDGVEEDQDFDTTCRVCVRGDRLYFKKVGDMAVTPEGQQEEVEEDKETEVDESEMVEDTGYGARRAEESAARKTFQGGF